MENVTTTKEYFDRLNEAGKQSPASWIIVSPRIAEEIKNQIKEYDHKNKIKLKK